jgi:YidC/Oxa1 family membrane protein insertase
LTFLFLTADNGKILGPIARLFGYLMNLIYIFQSQVLHLPSITLTIVLFTIFIYILLYPLTYRQQKFAILSQKMNPEIQAIQKKYNNKKDQASLQAMQEETQMVYDKYGISPVGSCIQLIIQAPIFFALYRVFYNIPAYINSVKNIFSGLVSGIIATDGYGKIMSSLIKNFGTRSSSAIKFAGNGSLADKNHIVDVLYQLNDKGWVALSGKKYFPELSGQIENVRSGLKSCNYLFGLNISDTPWHLITSGWQDKTYLVVFLALLLPVLSYLSQLLNIKVGQTSNPTNADDAMARQMKSMNLIMPLMSLIFAFTVPVGLTVYWIVGALVRTVQMLYLNKKFEKIDLNKIIEKNKKKAAEKAEKRGIKRAQIYEAAKINTRSNLSSKAKYKNNASSTDSIDNESKNVNYKKGSLASKANLVHEYNNKNSK